MKKIWLYRRDKKAIKSNKRSEGIADGEVE